MLFVLYIGTIPHLTEFIDDCYVELRSRSNDIIDVLEVEDDALLRSHLFAHLNSNVLFPHGMS